MCVRAARCSWQGSTSPRAKTTPTASSASAAYTPRSVRHAASLSQVLAEGSTSRLRSASGTSPASPAQSARSLWWGRASSPMETRSCVATATPIAIYRPHTDTVSPLSSHTHLGQPQGPPSLPRLLTQTASQVMPTHTTCSLDHSSIPHPPPELSVACCQIPELSIRLLRHRQTKISQTKVDLTWQRHVFIVFFAK